MFKASIMDSIFDIGKHTAEAAAKAAEMRYEKTEFKSNLFDPKVKQAGDSFTFIARPMPYIKTVDGKPEFCLEDSIIQKYYYCFKRPDGTNVWFDSPTTFNKPLLKEYHFCPLSDAWVRVKNSKDEQVQNLANNFRRQTAVYCYMLIINFPQQPEMNGKIVPMPIPIELKKHFDALLTPSQDAIALGATARLVYDLINGQAYQITALGQMQYGTLMRKWTVAEWRPTDAQGNPTCGNQAIFPLGPNGQWLPVTKLAEADVVKFIAEQETEDLRQNYGYKEPGIDARIAARDYINNILRGIPGLDGLANTYEYFKDLIPPTDVMQPAAQPIGTQQPAAQVPINQPTAVPNVAVPQQPITQPAVPNAAVPQQPIAQPAAQPVINQPAVDANGLPM